LRLLFRERLLGAFTVGHLGFAVTPSVSPCKGVQLSGGSEEKLFLKDWGGSHLESKEEISSRGGNANEKRGR